MADVLLTLSELTTYLPQMADAPAGTVQALIDAASRMAERFCNRTFVSKNVTERYAVTYKNRIYLKQYPVTNIDSIKLILLDDPALVDSCGYISGYESENTDLTVTNVPVTLEYTANPANGVLEFRNNLQPYMPKQHYSRPFYAIEVGYTGGYTTVPDLVKYAVAMLVESMYSRGRLDPSLKSEKIGDYSYTKSEEAPLLSVKSSVAEYLFPYVRHGVNGL